jgi:hypothetical protein
MDGWRELSYLFWSAYIYRGGWALYCDGGVSEARRLFAMGSRRLVRGERVDGNEGYEDGDEAKGVEIIGNIRSSQ